MEWLAGHPIVIHEIRNSTGCADSFCHFLMLAEYYPDAETELYAVHVVVYYYIPDHYLKC